MDQEQRYNQFKSVGYFGISFILVFLMSFLVLLFLEIEVRQTKVEELQRQEQRVVNLENEFMGREFKMIISDLHFLKAAYMNELKDADNQTHLIEHWIAFSSQKRIYDQIRFIAVNGDEKIRINLGKNGGYLVPQEALQNKIDRYYFTETIRIEDGGTYISPLDLNVEQGQIEVPYKPMIRLGTPVYTENGVLKGIIVLNYLAEEMLAGFRNVAKNSQGEIILLNAEGYRLSSEDTTKDWNFMFKEKEALTFGQEYPLEWGEILKGNRQETTDKGLFTGIPVDLSQKFLSDRADPTSHIYGGERWYILSLFERNDSNAGFFNDDFLSMILDVFKLNAYFFILIIFISGLVGLLVFINRKTYSKIKYYSEYDPLTKALNRRAGIQKLQNLFPNDDRRQFLVSLCFIDINGLKEVNDTLGHKIGDELIVSVSSVIKETIREQDFLIRLGGDEFLIVFNGIGLETAETIWSRIVDQYERINQNETRPYGISVSHGIVDYNNNKRKTPVDDLINAADEKMYQEKQVIKAGLSVIKNKLNV